MSGPIPPSLPDTSIVTEKSIPFPRELTEKEMMGMTIEELEAYSEELKSSIDLEYSTLTSYTKMQDTYTLSIDESQSTISGLDREINTNTIVYDGAVARKGQLDREIHDIDTYIISTISTVSGLDVEIETTDGVIRALYGESSTLTLELEASDAKFKQDAQNYSTLFYTYLAKQLAYDQNLSSIKGESTILESAKILESESYHVYQSTFNSYTSISREVSTLIDESFALQSSLTAYQTLETHAQRDLTSTIIAIESLSSLYETSLVTQRYYQAISTQSWAIESYNSTLGLYNEAVRQAEMYPSDTAQQAKRMAEGQLQKKLEEKEKIDTAVSQLQTNVADSQNAAYEALLKSYTDTIDSESRNVSTFSARRMSSENELRSYSTTYEQSLLDISTLTGNIRTFSTFYESSLTGAVKLEVDAARLYDSTISTNQSFLSIYSQLISAETAKYNSSLSSFQGYSTIQINEASTFSSFFLQLQAVSSLYESTNSAVTKLTNDHTSRRTQAESTFTALMAESTTFESVYIQQEVFQALIDQSLVQQELAALQFQETYARAKRIAVGEAYNVAILQEVQNVSSLNGLAKARAPPDTPIELRSVNMNSELIQQASNQIQMINTFINSYKNLYDTYDTHLQQMSSLSTAVGEKQNAVNNLATINETVQNQIYKSTTGSVTSPPTPANLTLYTQRTTEYQTKKGAADTSRTSVETMRRTLNETIQTYRQTYQSIFTATEQQEHETTISSFLIAGYNSAALLPAPTS
jgi:hypothetical protein